MNASNGLFTENLVKLSFSLFTCRKNDKEDTYEELKGIHYSVPKVASLSYPSLSTLNSTHLLLLLNLTIHLLFHLHLMSNIHRYLSSFQNIYFLE